MQDVCHVALTFKILPVAYSGKTSEPVTRRSQGQLLLEDIFFLRVICVSPG